MKSVSTLNPDSTQSHKIDMQSICQRIFKLFFMSYATMYCESKTVRRLARQLLTDVHPPHIARVTGVLRNMPEFARAFGCRKEDTMVADKPCKIW